MSTTTTKTPSAVEHSSSWEDKYAQQGFFNISSMAQQRIADKRKRKGLGLIKPREKSVASQLTVYGTSLTVMRTIGAPLERCRVIMQTLHMQNLKANEKPAGSTVSILSSKLDNTKRCNIIYRDHI
jgi:hypothetical protein